MADILLSIAHNYQIHSENLLEMSWDYAIDPDAEDNSNNINTISNN
jgi:hypothetical protein